MPGYYDEHLMGGDSDEEARYPLFRSESENSSQKLIKAAGKTSNGNRILVILSMVMILTFSLHFETSRGRLNDRLRKDEETMEKMHQTIERQEKVINRFNSSVTNSDVINRLSGLEASLSTATEELHHELDDTVDVMNARLDQTMVDLQGTVDKAEKDITDKVQQVENDYEEFQRKTNDQFSMENSFMVWQLAGTFTLLSCLISMWHMSAHLRELNQPIIQRKILAILWMCPIYAVTSWFSLVFPATEGYLAIVKDSYEAYIIYQFLSFCIAVIGKGQREKVVDLLAKRADHLPPPVGIRSLCCIEVEFDDAHSKARAVLLQCQRFAIQFVFWRPVTTIAKVLLKKYEYYGPWGAEGPNDWKAPQFYIFLIQNVSIFTAFTGLLKFYHLVDEDLAWCRPFAKFLCIKGVFFMTFWQGLAIAVLGETAKEGGGDSGEWASKTQSFLICLEMLVFSLAHYYCFPVDEWKDGYKVNYQKLHLGDSIALGDFFSDLKLVMSSKGKSSKQKKRSSRKLLSVQDTVEEEEGDGDGDDDETCDQVTEGGYDSDDQTADDASVSTSVTVDKPEVKEAQLRLNRFLDDVTAAAALEGADDGSESDRGGSSLAASSSPAVYDDTPRKQNTTSRMMGDDPGGEPTENTSLLSTPLKPSIFTSIAEIAEKSSSKQQPSAAAGETGEDQKV